MGDRYSVKNGSHSGHCCFDASVLDAENNQHAIAECFEVSDAERIVAALKAQAGLVEALRGTTAALVAATSLLSRGGKKAAPSDTMFRIMLSDYENAAEKARAALAAVGVGRE
jgi:hypothetical protein